ncbi:DUF4436 family protein [Candidatus Planktophila versatilis]|uniref:DUF4436 family protein n=1 Tax=Candidatus Planktophila versatilis TaxID=1884905 RepID=UPI003CF8DC5C
MHLTKNANARFWVISAVLIVASIGLLNIFESGIYKLDKKSDEIYSQVKDEEKITLFVMLKNYDAPSQTLQARVWVTPPEEFGTNLGDSFQVKYDTRVQLSASKIEHNNSDNSWYWTATEFLRAIDIEIDASNYEVQSRSKDTWFPFDHYSADLSGLIQFCVTGCETDDLKDDNWKSLPIEVVPYTASMPGWSATFKANNFEGQTDKQTFTEGAQFASSIILYRTNLNIALTLLLGFIFLGGGFSMLLLFRSILMNHRPPTLSGLIWSGSTAFTMIQTRNVIPGDPRIGVKFDLFIFYPSLILCFVSGGMMFYHWISKDTWSREL